MDNNQNEIIFNIEMGYNQIYSIKSNCEPEFVEEAINCFKDDIEEKYVDFTGTGIELIQQIFIDNGYEFVDLTPDVEYVIDPYDAYPELERVNNINYLK